MNLFKEIFSGRSSFHAVLIVASILFVFLFSTSTSPLYSSWGDDSAIFQAVGKGWTEGRLPYVDMFENKGALIFLIDALGYMIYPRIGIFILQIPAMYFSFLLAWRSLGLFLSGKTKFVAAIFMIIFDAVYYLDGNRTEEWSMPFLMASTYFFLRGLKEEKFSCPPLVGFINGLGFGACVLLRTTNAASLCCCAFLSAIFLFKAGEFKILLKNILNFCAGAVIIILPFVIYFAAHGALYDMLYGTILLNVIYSAQRENFLLTHLDDFAVYIAIHFMSLYLMILISVAAFVKNKSRLAISGLFCGAIILAMLIKLSPYLGYCALITPLLPIFFALLSDYAENFRELWSDKNFSVKRIICKFIVVIVMIYPLILLRMVSGFIESSNSEFASKYDRNENSEMLRLGEFIPPEERNSVMIWGEGFNASHWILTTGIFPSCRFFGNVKAFANVDPNVKREWFEFVRNNSPKWIIYSAPEKELADEKMEIWMKFFRTNRDTDVERLLQERYNLVGETKTYQNFFGLYRLKER